MFEAHGSLVLQCLRNATLKHLVGRFQNACSFVVRERHLTVVIQNANTVIDLTENVCQIG